jgi:hypothetical protein
MELVSCHPSGCQNFEVASRFMENLWTHALLLDPCFFNNIFFNSIICLKQIGIGILDDELGMLSEKWSCYILK